MSNSCLEVSRKAFMNNVLTVKKYINNEAGLIPVIKADAYGTYINRDIDLMNVFDIVAVALVSEALELKNNGYKGDVLVLNQPFLSDISDIFDNDIVVGVCEKEFLNNTLGIDKKVRIHIELETGMGRTGVCLKELDEFLAVCKKNSNILVEGVYTHFSSADIDSRFTNKQINLFNEGIKKVKEVFPDIKYIHMAASNGILNYDLGFCNYVRPGIILYGFPSNKSCLEKIKLEPVVSFKSKISFIKKIDVGDSIGYGRSFVSDCPRVVATVSCGYADGVRRELSNKGFVSIKECKCRILGKICMDSFMVDITNIKDVFVGDDVYIFDNKIVTVDDIALICDTINYEILTGIGQRVKRVFVD